MLIAATTLTDPILQYPDRRKLAGNYLRLGQGRRPFNACLIARDQLLVRLLVSVKPTMPQKGATTLAPLIAGSI